MSEVSPLYKTIDALNARFGKGLETISRHCEDFIRTRLAPANPPNDISAAQAGRAQCALQPEAKARASKQTPMRGHPVFKAQHACACCCRDCLSKWWKVPKDTDIPPERQSRIVDFLMAWIGREMDSQR